MKYTYYVTAHTWNKILISFIWKRSQSNDSLRAGRPGDKIAGGVKFSAPALTGPGAHSTSCRMGTGLLPRLKRPEGGVNHPLPLARRLKKESNYIHSTSVPSCLVISEIWLYIEKWTLKTNIHVQFNGKLLRIWLLCLLRRCKNKEII
jgi:hypothetical protein